MLKPAERSRRKVRVFTILLLSKTIQAILGKGLKILPVTHKRCSKTANFRATATTARLLADLPPPAFIKPHWRSAESRPHGPRM